jgi:Domain of unknown function (DUF4276)
MRPLTVGLFAEGKSDLHFLGGVLDRQLTELSFSGGGFDFTGVLRARVSTVSAASRLDPAVIEASGACNLVLVHHDHNEAAKIDALRERLAPADLTCGRIMGVVPVRETEAWMLADRRALEAVRGTRLDGVPGSAAELERLADPKAVLRAARDGDVDDELFQRLGDTVDLDRLTELPAYQNFLQDLTTALKELNFR